MGGRDAYGRASPAGSTATLTGMATADHPDIPFIEAHTVDGGPAYTPGRKDGPPIWVVVHDMEYPERETAAEWHAEYLARGAGGRSVSAHYGADNNSIIQSVRLGDVAWTVGNRPGNYRGINWELAGYASQTREQWLDPFGRAMLGRVAEIMRRDMARFQIPARLLSDDQVRAFTPGVTSHWQLGRVFGGTDHWDPGRGFPWDHLIALLGDDMPLTVEDLTAIRSEVRAALAEPVPFTSPGVAAYAAGAGWRPQIATRTLLEYVWERVMRGVPTDLPARLDAILAAAADDANPEAVLAPEHVATLQAIRDALATLPAATADAVIEEIAS